LEDALYDSQALRAFAGHEEVPDATTLLKFRHLLERHGLTQRILTEVNALLAERGAFLREGTIVDATIIAAAPSTKNKDKARDPEMHQTKKGNAWHFGMKAHIGVDAHSGLVHTVSGTAANVADVAEAHAVLHGEEKMVYADAAKRSKVKAMADGPRKELTQALEKAKAQMRAYVEHPFHILKNLFAHRKVRYRGLAKNTAQLYSLFALANLVIAKSWLTAEA
jgi:IS5 family transposase